MQIQLPYGKGSLPLDVPDKNLLGVVLPKEIIPPERPESLIRTALDDPLGPNRLSDIASSGDRVAIVVDDHTRPCPNELLLLPVLEDLKKTGVYDADVTVIVANGSHKPPSFELMKQVVGDKVSRNYTVVSNDSVNGEFVQVGISKLGNEIEILREYVDADVKIILGDIGYHYFAGYSGTRKSILPGIASEKTIQRNHKLLFEEHACTGVLKGNPVHLEMNEAMHLAGCDFTLNVVINSHHRIIGAWAGNPESVLDVGVKLVDDMYKRYVDEKADVVVAAANGHPHDLDLYQVVKALHGATQVLKEKGVLVLIAECSGGHGSEMYVEWMKKYKTSAEVEKALRENFKIGAHKAYYHFKATEKHPVIFVSKMEKSLVEDIFKFKVASDPNAALKKAFETVGEHARVLVVPQGTTTFATTR